MNKLLMKMFIDLEAWAIGQSFNSPMLKRLTLCEPYRWKDGNLRHIAMQEIELPVNVHSMRRIIGITSRIADNDKLIGFGLSENFFDMWANEINTQRMNDYVKWQARLKTLWIKTPELVQKPKPPHYWCGQSCELIKSDDMMRLRIYWVIQGYMDPADKGRYMDESEGDDRYGYSLHQSCKVGR
jgi:hypothetical protein